MYANKYVYNAILVILIIDKKFWEELIAYFPLKRHGQHRKRKKIRGRYTDIQRARIFLNPP
jgi:hypothetical protein